MAIVNRDLDPSQQRDIYNCPVYATVTGATYNLCVVPYPAQLVAVTQAAKGLSGAPNHSIWIQRFVVGSGVTSINVGNSLVASTFGTSGVQGFSLPSASSLLLQANDVLLLATAAANTAAENVTVTLVVKALQDIKTCFGV